MAKKLTNNLGLKILAVLVSIVLWFIAVNINDPVSTQAYNVKVNVIKTGFDTSDKYTEVDSNTDHVRVVVKATRSELKDFNENFIIATADADNDYRDGKVPIKVELSGASSVKGAELIYDEDAYVELRVEDNRRRQMPIKVNTIGSPEENYMLVSASTAQNAVMLHGPESLVNSVSSVSVDIDIDEATSDVNISLPIHLYDANGKEITDKRIEKSITDVNTTATIWMVKSLPVEYKYSGVPADGYRVKGNLSAEIYNIQVAGKPSVMKNTQKLVINDALDISGATSDVEKTIDLKKMLPDGMMIADSDIITQSQLELKIEKIPEEGTDTEENE